MFLTPEEIDHSIPSLKDSFIIFLNFIQFSYRYSLRLSV